MKNKTLIFGIPLSAAAGMLVVNFYIARSYTFECQNQKDVRYLGKDGVLNFIHDSRKPYLHYDFRTSDNSSNPERFATRFSVNATDFDVDSLTSVRFKFFEREWKSGSARCRVEALSQAIAAVSYKTIVCLEIGMNDKVVAKWDRQIGIKEIRFERDGVESIYKLDGTMGIGRMCRLRS